MTLSEFADIADLVAAFGLIASLLFLAWELRKNSEQARLQNWYSVLAALREHKRRTDDLSVSDVLYRGRESYEGLSGSEKILFGHWMEEWLQAQEGLLIFRHSNAHRREDLTLAARGNFRSMFSYPGCREWWIDSGLADRWPRSLVDAVSEAISEIESSRRR
ncbi:MAG: hypothetical protein CL535_01720 [Ahrensia sp.]|nr:hypothetical protein [Ahrensia sp.]